MKYDIAAIETVYKNRIFRSRLEATWAAMFDLLGWGYEYEPFDMNGWLPDFVITGKNGDKKSLLVEVKPYNFAHGKNINDFHQDRERILNALPQRSEFLFLGLSPYKDPEYYDGMCIGKLVQKNDDALYDIYDDAAINKDTDGSGYDICDTLLSYAYRLSGHYDGNKNPEHFDTIDKMWGMAKHKVKYK